MTIPNAMIFAKTINLANTKLSPALLLHCAPGPGGRVDVEPLKHAPRKLLRIFLRRRFKYKMPFVCHHRLQRR